MKSLDIQESTMTQAEELVCQRNMKCLPRRQSSIRREIIVEGEFCEYRILNVLTTISSILINKLIGIVWK